MNIGERIKAIRKQKKITQETIANALGVQRSAVSKYEKGIVSPSWEAIQKIAEALDVSVPELLNDVSMLSYNTEAKNKLERTMELLVKKKANADKQRESLLENYDKLNTVGKNFASDVVKYLATDNKYTTPDEE